MLVFNIDFHAQVDQELLSLESGVSCRTWHVNCEMKQISAMVVNLVDIGAQSMKALDLCIVSSHQSNFESIYTSFAHLVDICTFLA